MTESNFWLPLQSNLGSNTFHIGVKTFSTWWFWSLFSSLTFLSLSDLLWHFYYFLNCYVESLTSKSCRNDVWRRPPFFPIIIIYYFEALQLWFIQTEEIDNNLPHFLGWKVHLKAWSCQFWLINTLVLPYFIGVRFFINCFLQSTTRFFVWSIEILLKIDILQ